MPAQRLLRRIAEAFRAAASPWRLAAAAALSLACTAGAANLKPAPSGDFSVSERAQGYRDGVVIVKPRPEMAATIDAAEAAEGLSLRARYDRFGSIRVLQLAQGVAVADAVARLKATGRYLYVEPDYLRHALVAPNDPNFNLQWHLHNTGANGGIAGADINAENGWNTLTSAPTVIVGILDSGALLTHEDLVQNFWVNPAPGTTASYASVGGSLSETDSLNGLNAVAGTGTPLDDVGHGTHVSGIVGAVGNNGVGVSGVAWGVQLMELKFLDSTGTGSTSAELPCIEYAIAHKVGVINGSFGSSSGSQAEMDAIYSAGQAGIIFVCAAGNNAENIDISPEFPADYPVDNLVAVGATDNRDLPAIFSNYASGSVEIFAPGDTIYSTYNGSTSDYEYLSGTSMASPMVAGVAALLKAKYPSDTYRETINRILNSADPKPALAGKAQTGGRVDLANALATAANTPPNALFASRMVLVGADPYLRSNNADSPATLEAGTPVISGIAGGHSLWWQWTAPENGTAEIDTSGTTGGRFQRGGSTYPTLLAVYTGGSLASLNLVQANANFGTESIEGGGASTYSEVNFPVTAGTTYVINVQGQGSSSGQTILSINTHPSNDSFSSPTVLAGPSVSLLDANPSATRQAGEPQIQGNPGGHSLWYAWTAPKSGPFHVSAYSYDFTPEAAVFTGSSISALNLVTEAAGTSLKGTATAAAECVCGFNATAGVTYMIDVDGVTASDTGEFTVTIDDSRWQVMTGDAVTCSPAVGPDGTVYIGSDDNSMYAIGQNGATKWIQASGGIFDTSAAVVGPDGTIYAGSFDGKLYAYNPVGGTKWTYPIPGSGAPPVSSSPALGSDGTVYFHGEDGNLYALTSAGTLKWTASVPGVSYAAPTIAPDGTIYIGSDGGIVYAFTPSGSQKWSFTTPNAGDAIYTAASIDASGNLYFGTLGGFVYSLNSSGGLRWTYAVGDGVTSAPVLANGSVYFAGYDANLYSLTISGTLQWKFPIGAQARASAPAVDASGNIYVGCYDHNVYAVSPSGALVRTYASNDSIRSSPVIAGTTLYFGSNDHMVYAFDLGQSSAAADWPMYQYDSRRLGRAVSDPLAITAQPASQNVATGASLTLYVGATGPGPLTYQWSLNGSPIAGAVNSTYSVASTTASDAGSYTATVSGPSGSLTTSSAAVSVGSVGPTPTPTPAPSGGGRIVNLSARAQVGTGGNILIAGFVIQGSGNKNVLLRGDGPALGGAPFDVAGFLAQPSLSLVSSQSGATLATDTAWGGGAALSNAFSQVGAFALSPTSADSALLENLPAGAYTSEITGVGGTTGVALAEIYDADAGTPATSLANISARAQVGTGGNILIAGFVVQGGQPVTVLLRGVGPTLGAAPYNVPGVLAQPQITLYNAAGTQLQTNAGWGGSTSLQATFAQVGAFALPSGSADAAMVATLPAGAYTVELSGINGATGVALVEVYLVP